MLWAGWWGSAEPHVWENQERVELTLLCFIILVYFSYLVTYVVARDGAVEVLADPGAPLA